MAPELVSTLWTHTTSVSLGFFKRYLEFKPTTPEQLARLAESENLRKFFASNPEWWRSGEETLTWLKKNGARITYPGRDDYPGSFADLERPPLFVSYFGEPCWKMPERLSVVGSREPGHTSRRWLETELSPLMKRKFLIVSGGARGVDQCAHKIALRAGGATAVFLPAGLGRMYPSDLTDWIEPVLECGGAFVSELGPLEPMLKHYFLQRNRMIAALSKVTLIVEARRQSGTMITARLAEEIGRELAVVPGPPCDPRWAGNLELLCNGAKIARDYWDLLTILNLKHEHSVPVFP
ncbi:MAG: DNA-processing protein DprA [Bdellovibrionia bacterium]